MQTMNISLPDPLKEFVDAKIAEGRYSSVSEYVRELIRADERAAKLHSIVNPDDYHRLTDDEREKAEDQLEAALLEGMEGGSVTADDQYWQGFRARAVARHESRRKKGSNEND